MVMGDDSCLSGCGFNPGTVYWMDMTFFHIDLLQRIVLFFLKSPKINEIETGVG